jgi:hypothetical protein|tara:strand:+ start:10246 stop:10458 length:213 start_codon:yes stop_codon:yes gene_type:complete
VNGDIQVGDLVLWWKTDPSVMGIVLDVYEGDEYMYPGINVLWFSERVGHSISVCRKTDVSVLSRAQSKKD